MTWFINVGFGREELISQELNGLVAKVTLFSNLTRFYCFGIRSQVFNYGGYYLCTDLEISSHLINTDRKHSTVIYLFKRMSSCKIQSF